METLDKAYFESIIGEPIDCLRVSSGSKSGDNVAGSLKAIKISLSSGRQLNLICKLMPENQMFHSGMIQLKMMEHEVNFYHFVVPAMEKFLQTYDLPKMDYLPFPEYVGGSDRWLVLQDLRPFGFKMADKYLGLDVDHVSLVMRHLGRFHAAGYAFLRYEGLKFIQGLSTRDCYSNFVWLPPWMDSKLRMGLNQANVELAPIIRGRLSERLADKMCELAARFQELFIQTHDKTEREYFATLVHSDAWTNNIMFKYENGSSGATSEKVTELRLLDMQQLKRGNVFEDLMYFFVTSTTVEFRKRHLFQSLRLYYSEFEKTLQLLKCPLPISFTFGYLIDHYHKNLLQIGLFAGIAIALQLGKLPGDDRGESGEVSVEEEAANDDKSESKRGFENEGDQVLLTPAPEVATPLGSHYQALAAMCPGAILGDERATERYLSLMDELDKLGVFD